MPPRILSTSLGAVPTCLATVTPLPPRGDEREQMTAPLAHAVVKQDAAGPRPVLRIVRLYSLWVSLRRSVEESESTAVEWFVFSLVMHFLEVVRKVFWRRGSSFTGYEVTLHVFWP